LAGVFSAVVIYIQNKQDGNRSIFCAEIQMFIVTVNNGSLHYYGADEGWDYNRISGKIKILAFILGATCFTGR
jgi:hypothetical protein